MADILGSAGLDLDEDDRSAVEDHKIEFARCKAAATGKDLVTQPPEMPGRLVFATLAEGLPRDNTPQPAGEEFGKAHGMSPQKLTCFPLPRHPSSADASERPCRRGRGDNK